MKSISIYRGIALLTIALGAAACQSELLPSENSPEQKQGEKVTFTIRATQGGSTDSSNHGNTPQTRTEYEDGLTEDGTGTIGVKWKATSEAIKVWGYNSDDAALNSAENGIVFNETSNHSVDGKRIDFTGSIDKKDAYFAVYPSTIGYDEDSKVIYRYFISQKQDCTPGNEMKHLGDTYDVMLGTSHTPGATDDFSFRHLAVMLRFDITLPDEAKKITGIELLCDNRILYGALLIGLKDGKPLVRNTFEGNSVTLVITKHTAAQTLKAYMMLPHIDLTEAQTLTVGVNTAGGNAYVGSLNTTAGTTLTPGNCYTLTPTLTKVDDPTLTVADLTTGKLSGALNALTSTQMFGKTKLMLSGAVSNEEFLVTDTYGYTLIQRFLMAHGQFTEVDLSQVTELTEIKGFNSCRNLTNIILPSAVATIKDNAFAYCSALTTITLPASVTGIDNYAFNKCTALQSILFEGTKTVGTDLTLGNIIDGTPATLAIFLPNITEEAVAKSYQLKFTDKNVYYNYSGDYATATAAQKVDATNYTLCPTN